MLLVAPVALAIGLTLGLVGGGGAVLLVPLLTVGLGYGVHEATTAALAAVGIAALVATGPLSRRGLVCWPAALKLALPAMIAAALGAYLNSLAPEALLLASLAVLMGLVAWRLWVRAGPRSSEPDDDAVEPGCPAATLVGLAPLGAAVGLLTGFLGVGGGVLIVPALVVVLEMGMRRAVGTSLAIVAAASAVGFAGHLATGSGIAAGEVAIVASVVSAGALVGVLLSPRIDTRSLMRGLAIVVGAVAIVVAAQAAAG